MKKRLWSILLVACMVLTLLPFGAFAAADDVVWTLNGTTLMVSCDGDMPDYDDDDAKAPWLANKGTVTSVIVEEGATSIGENAFKDFTALTSVTLPDSLEFIGKYAFSGCKKLESVTIPENVTTIDASAFSGCTKLATVTFAGTSISNIAKNAFKDTAVKDVYFNGTEDQWDDVNIADETSSNKKLKDADLHAICDADKHKWRTENELDATCQKEGYTGDRVCKVCGFTKKGEMIPMVAHKWGDWEVTTKVTDSRDGAEQRTCKAIRGAYHTETVKIPAGTAYTPVKTAEVLEDAATITVKNTRGNLVWLAWYAAGMPKASSEFKMPFTDVSKDAAYYDAVLWAAEQHYVNGTSETTFAPDDTCTRVVAATILNRINGRDATDEQENFPNDVPATITYNGGNSWTIPAPDSAETNDFVFVISTDGKTAGVAEYKGTAKNVTIPEKAQGATVTAIRDGAFAGVTTMESVSIPATVTSIGNRAFEGCTALKSVSIPSAVKSIGNYAFSDCDALTSVEVPEGVTSIGDYAFANCDKLASATLPKSLKTLGANIFANDDALKDVYYKSGEQDWKDVKGDKSFDDSDTTLHYDADASHLTWRVEDGKAIITGSKSVSGDLVIPATVGDNIPVVEIDDGAFYGCDKLTSVTIPEGVTTIGESAFENCTGLKKVTLPKSLVMVDKDAFDGTNVKEVHYGSTVEDWDNVVIKSGNDVLKNLKVGESFFPADCKEHKTEIKDAKEATCTEKGFTGNEVCTVCGKTIKAGEEIPALGHDWGEWKLTKPATATEKGEETRVCKRDASHVETRPSDDTGVKPVNFVDVNAGDYFADAVSWAVNHNPVITTGTDPLHFSPYDNCTRAQMVTFLWRAAGEPKPTSSVNPFTDVPANEYFYTAVLWAVEQNITTGTSLTTFSPYDQVTRAQTVTFLWRMAKQPVVVTANPFTDVPAGEYYTNAVLWAVQEKITTGITATTFEPDSPCTRAQIVTFLYRDLGQAK